MSSSLILRWSVAVVAVFFLLYTVDAQDNVTVSDVIVE